MAGWLRLACQVTSAAGFAYPLLLSLLQEYSKVGCQFRFNTLTLKIYTSLFFTIIVQTILFPNCGCMGLMDVEIS